MAVTTRKKRLLLLLVSVLVALSAAFVEIQTRMAHGTLAGEAFYRWRPTSYWSRELRGLDGLMFSDRDTVFWHRRRGAWQYWVYDHTPLLRPYIFDDLPILRGDSKAFNVLVALLDDEWPKVRYIAADSLGELKRYGKPAVPALLACLNDEHEGVRRSARHALREIDPEAAKKAGIK
jgi:HEAT repeats